MSRSIRNRFAGLMSMFYMFAGVSAQVHIQPSLPAVGLVQKDQLWNLVIINGTTAAMNGQIKLVLQDRVTGLDVLSATTATFQLPQGSVSVNTAQLNPILYSNTAIFGSAGTGGLLPVGMYSACYLFSKDNGESFEALNEECMAFDVEPLSPPLLIFPPDSSIAQTSSIQFTWTPPAPSSMFTQLTYEINIVEILQGQLPSEAIQDNLPIFSSTSIGSNLFSYTAAAPTFSPDKWYAWQVIARDQQQYAGKSETWIFSIHQDSLNTDPLSIDYLLLDNQESKPTSLLKEKVLHVKFYSFDPEHIASVTIRDVQGRPMQIHAQQLGYGDNYFTFNLNRSFSENTLYRVEIVDNKGKVSKGQFIITQ